MTYIIFSDKEFGPTIRMFVRLGMYSTLKNTLIKLMTGDYVPNKNLISRSKHQLAISPVCCPDQRNWIHQAQVDYKTMIAERVSVDKKTRKNRLANLVAQIKRISDDLDITPANCKKSNIGVITHLIARERGFLNSSNDSTGRMRHQQKIDSLEKKLIEFTDKLKSLELERDELKANPIEVPVKFGKMYIDFRSNKYITMREIIQIIDNLIIKTHGSVYLTSMHESLIQIADQNKSDFINEFYDNDRVEALRLKHAVDESFAESTERLVRSMAEFVLDDEDADDESIESQLEQIALQAQ